MMVKITDQSQGGESNYYQTNNMMNANPQFSHRSSMRAASDLHAIKERFPINTKDVDNNNN